MPSPQPYGIPLTPACSSLAHTIITLMFGIPIPPRSLSYLIAMHLFKLQIGYSTAASTTHNFVIIISEVDI